MTAYWVFVLLLITVGQTLAAPFQNLGFDEGSTNNVQYLPRDPFTYPFLPDAALGPPAELVPGWDLFRGLNTPVSTVGYNLIGFRAGAPDNYFSIISRDANPNVEGLHWLEIFQPTFGLRLSQEGDVPSDAKFLTFRAFGPIAATINNNIGLITEFDSAQNIVLSDISAFAGQHIRLTFVVPGESAAIDSIAFIVPEPSTYVLLGVGGFVFLVSWLHRKIKRSHSLFR